MSSKIVIVTICLLVAVASAIPAQVGLSAGGWGGPPAAGGWGGPPAAGGWGPPGAGGWGAGVNPWIPPWIASAPWMPQWVPCVGVGNTCLDCSTKLVCTKVGGLQRACTDPALPYCNLGACSATPAEGCGPVPAVPADTAA